MQDGEEDGNNNGDINGNSEMVDLHDRRIQEEREREAQSRERSQILREEVMVNEFQDIAIDIIPPQPIITARVVNENDDGILTRVQGAFSLDHSENEANVQIHSCENIDVLVEEGTKDNITSSSQNEMLAMGEGTSQNISLNTIETNISDYSKQRENKNSSDDSEPSDKL